jgi:lysophospholipase L1-like esterase
MAPVDNLVQIVSQPRPEKRGRFNEKFYALFSNRILALGGIILALGGILLGSAILALLVVLVRGQHSQARVIEQLAEQVGIRSPADLGNRRLEVRSFMIRSQLAQATSPIVVVGDSITEAALLPSSVCGHDVVNAGIGGMTVGSYLPLAKQLLAGRRVQSIVIALGTNDSGILSTAHIEQDYASLIDELAKHTTKILLAGLPPFEMSGELAGRYFDQASADRNDTAIRSLAAARNLPFVDLRSAMHGDGLTVDGIHLTAAAYRQWREAVQRNIYSALGCID